MAGTFGARIAHLRHEVGNGRLRGTVEVDQVYAAYQHYHPEFHHPDGGQAYYLEQPLYQDNPEHMQQLAHGTLTSTGSNLHNAMAECMEKLSRKVYELAPWEFGDLRDSGHPKVRLNGNTIYDRPPHTPRLTEEELRIKGRLRQLFDPNRYGFEATGARRVR